MIVQVKKIEDEIGLGQIEEVIGIAKREMALVEYNYGKSIFDLVVHFLSTTQMLRSGKESKDQNKQPMK